MSFNEEIARVLEDQERAEQKLQKRRQVGSARRAAVSRRQPPTYFAWVIGKIIYWFNKKTGRRAKPRVPAERVQAQQVQPDKNGKRRRPKPEFDNEDTLFGILIEDVKSLVKIPERKKKLPESKESFKDWDDYFSEGP